MGKEGGRQEGHPEGRLKMKPALAVLAVSLSALAAKNPVPQTIKFDLSKDGIEHIVGSFTSGAVVSDRRQRHFRRCDQVVLAGPS